MQKILSYFCFLLFCIVTILPEKLFSQEQIKEVSLVYDITLNTSKNSALIKSFEGARLSIFIKGNLSRTDMSSTIGTESNIYNNSNKSGFILKEYSGQKLIITLTESNWFSRNRFFSSISFEGTNEEKVINGFKCKKSKALAPSSYVTEVYVLDDRQINNKSYYNCFSNLSGIPVKYSVKKGDEVFTYTLRSINDDNIVSSIFDEPQTGYRKITYEEAIKVKGEEK